MQPRTTNRITKISNGISSSHRSPQPLAVSGKLPLKWSRQSLEQIMTTRLPICLFILATLSCTGCSAPPVGMRRAADQILRGADRPASEANVNQENPLCRVPSGIDREITSPRGVSRQSRETSNEPPVQPFLCLHMHDNADGNGLAS